MTTEVEDAYVEAVKCQAEADAEPKVKAEAAWAAVAAAQWRATSIALIEDAINRGNQ